MLPLNSLDPSCSFDTIVHPLDLQARNHEGLSIMVGLIQPMSGLLLTGMYSVRSTKPIVRLSHNFKYAHHGPMSYLGLAKPSLALPVVCYISHDHVVAIGKAFDLFLRSRNPVPPVIPSKGVDKVQPTSFPVVDSSPFLVPHIGHAAPDLDSSIITPSR